MIKISTLIEFCLIYQISTFIEFCFSYLNLLPPLPKFGFAKTCGKWLVLVHLCAQLEMLNLIVLSNCLRLNTIDHLSSVFKFRFEYFNAKIYFPSTHWKSSYQQDCVSATFCVTTHNDICFLLTYELEYMEASYKYDV